MKIDLPTVIGFGIALSGWGKVVYDHVTSRPKIRGRIFQMMKAQMAHPQEREKVLSAFIAYLYLVNKRRNTIHILDYELEAKINRKWVKLSRLYGLHNVRNSFGAITGGNIQIRNFEDNLIYRKNKPVEYGQPLHGWICFVGPDTLYTSEVAAFQLTCIDTFQKKHRIVTKPSEFGSIYLLQDIADISVPPPAGL
jgi:hypothetical protein